jgi:tetratricopeptide (TPR) repeat protein
VWAEGRPAEGRRLAGAFFRYWFLRGHLAEGLRWLAPLVPADEEDPTVDGMKVSYGTGVLMSYTGRLEEAEAVIDRVLAMARRLGSRSSMASALCMYNATLRARDDRAGLRAGLEEAVRLARLGEREPTLNLSLNILGQARAVAGEHDAAEAVLSEALALARRRGDRSSLGLTGALLGMVLLHADRGDAAAAREALWEELAFALARERSTWLAAADDGHRSPWRSPSSPSSPDTGVSPPVAARPFGAAARTACRGGTSRSASPSPPVMSSGPGPDRSTRRWKRRAVPWIGSGSTSC